jgi:hypothetical protein
MKNILILVLFGLLNQTLAAGCLPEEKENHLIVVLNKSYESTIIYFQNTDTREVVKISVGSKETRRLSLVSGSYLFALDCPAKNIIQGMEIVTPEEIILGVIASNQITLDQNTKEPKIILSPIITDTGKDLEVIYECSDDLLVFEIFGIPAIIIGTGLIILLLICWFSER